MRILKSKKAWLSVGAIVLSFAMMFGASYAWWTVSGGDGTKLDMGKLEVTAKFFPEGFFEDDVTETSKMVPQPGLLYIPDTELDPGYGEDWGIIKNTGNVAALLEIQRAPKVTINMGYADRENQDDEDFAVVTPVAGYTLADENNGINFYLVIDKDDNDNYGYSGSQPDIWTKTVFHWVIRDEDSSVERHFLEFRPGAELKVVPVLDMATNARLNTKVLKNAKKVLGDDATEAELVAYVEDELRQHPEYYLPGDDSIYTEWAKYIVNVDNSARYIGNKYMGAKFEGVATFNATQADQSLAILDIFGANQLDFDWVEDDGMVTPFSEDYVTPAQIIRYFAAQK